MGAKLGDFEIFYRKMCSSLSLWKMKPYQSDSFISYYKDEASSIEELITRAFSLGESNSLLVIGPRGCGKTSLINAIIDSLKVSGILQLGLIVRLTGLLQTDDRLALREITRQLNIDGDSACKFGSFAENLNFILKTLQSGNKDTSKPILFILDEFDLFCHHRNQTLLYNLFDIAQSAQAPICVIGLTTRLDVIELFEKRVKSRFSHRQIFLFPQNSFESYLETCKEILKIEEHSLRKKEFEAGISWNRNVDTVLENANVINILKQRFSLYKDIRNLKSFLVLVIAGLSPEFPLLTEEHFKDAFSIVSDDAKKNILQGLSVLQLSLLIAMKHLHSIYDGEPFNFEMVYRQYNKFGEKHSSMSSYERPVVFKAFDQLECLELIKPVEHGRSTLQREYRLMQLLITPQQIEETINNASNLPTFLQHWCTSNVL